MNTNGKQYCEQVIIWESQFHQKYKNFLLKGYKKV
jgi:hypothetical protein